MPLNARSYLTATRCLQLTLPPRAEQPKMSDLAFYAIVISSSFFALTSLPQVFKPLEMGPKMYMTKLTSDKKALSQLTSLSLMWPVSVMQLCAVSIVGAFFGLTAPFVAAIAEQASPAAIAASEVADIASSVWSTTAGLMYFIEYFHLAHDMEWWAAIMATTTIMRLFVMPFMVMQQRVAARMHIAKPEIEALNARIKGMGGDQQVMAEAQKEIFAIWKKHNCNPAYMMLPIAVQAPLFISFYFAISEMAKGVPSFASGGPDWLLGPISMHDLTAADPTYIMPVLSSATFLATVELGGAGNPETSGAAQQTMMTKWGLRALSVALIPMTAGFSKGVFVYWITTNMFSLGQTLAFKVPLIKKIVAIPEIPKEATIGAKASVVTKREIEQKFGAEPIVHTSNPKVSFRSHRSL